ncbi:MAG: hypothetical protein GY938_16730 [Ketobacter sp.]|nr:hypothetical protein [Ketobacter sp.]
MTFDQHIDNYLDERLVLPKAKQEIINALKASPAAASMVDRWGHDVSEYDQSIIIGIRIQLNDVALKWFDDNRPKAFNRGLFQRGY